MIEAMKGKRKSSKQVESHDNYFVLTGNPFVDAGIYAIEAYYGKNYSTITPTELNKKIPSIANLYLTKGWNKNIYSIFFNSKLVNPSSKKKGRKYQEAAYSNYLKNLVKEFTFANTSGSCIACGRREALPTRKRDEIPLTGSGNLINFFSAGVTGERYCPVCTFAVQFMPLFLYTLGGKFLLLHSISSKIMKDWAKRGIINIQEQISAGNYAGCMEDGYKRGENALFHIIEEIVQDSEELYCNENPSISAYIFTNFGQTPQLNIIHLPNSVFRFFVYIKRFNNPGWNKIVKKGYWNVNKENENKWKKNWVYYNLLSGKSIIRYFFNKERDIIADWEIFSYYLKEVRQMNKKRIAVLKRVGGGIANYIEQTNNTKRLFALETAKTFEGMRNVLLKIVKDMIAIGAEGPLFSTDEFIEDLFPEGALGWKETRDILLFKIYEQLHDYLRDKKVVKLENEAEENEEV